MGERLDQGIAIELRLNAQNLEEGSSSSHSYGEAAPEFGRIVAEHLPARVAYVDRDLRFRFLNEEYACAYGRSAADSEGRLVSELEGNEAFSLSGPLFQRALDGETVLHEVDLELEGGIRVESRLVPHRDADGDVIGVVVFATDITLQRRAEAVLAKESARLAVLLDNAPAFTALMEGPDFTFTFANEAYLKLVGHRDVIGMPVRQAFPELAERGFFELLDNVLMTGTPFIRKEMPILLQNEPEGDLQRRYIDVVYQVVADAEGRAYGVFAHGVDVTERVRARKEIAEREELFRTVFEQASDDAMVMIDADRTITAWNPAAYRICGWSEAEAVGQPIDIIFTPEDQALGGGADDAAEATRAGRASDERWHQRKNGERFWGSGTINPLHHADGSVRGFLKVFRDATDRHNLVQQIDLLNEELEAKVADRTRDLQQAVKEAEGFNYAISHDLRTPLRAMVSTSMILLEEAGPELSLLHRELLDRQAHNAVRLGEMIDALLRLSRFARVEVKRQRIDMSALAHASAADLEKPCDVAVQEGMTAHADPALVRTVLQNLFDNAFKFCLQVATVQVGQTDGVFWVRDEGVGFDLKFAPKIFLPFERLVSEAEFPGTGIGLANVERIVKRHGGRIWVESAPGKGATFYFTLEAERDGA